MDYGSDEVDPYKSIHFQKYHRKRGAGAFLLEWADTLYRSVAIQRTEQFPLFCTRIPIDFFLVFLI